MVGVSNAEIFLSCIASFAGGMPYAGFRRETWYCRCFSSSLTLREVKEPYVALQSFWQNGHRFRCYSSGSDECVSLVKGRMAQLRMGRAVLQAGEARVAIHCVACGCKGPCSPVLCLHQ